MAHSDSSSSLLTTTPPVNKHDIKWENLDKTKYYGFSGGLLMITRSIVYPFMLIKTRLQVQKGFSQYSGTLDAFLKISRTEGIRGFFKGLVTTAVGIVPGQFLYITIYEVVRSQLRNFINHKDNNRVEVFTNFMGGACASLFSSTITVPLDVISQLLMIQDGKVNKRTYTGGIHACKEIIRTEGIRGVYRGYAASVMVYAPSSALWWSFYSILKRNIMIFKDKTRFKGKGDLLCYSACGVTSGIITVTITSPLDVVKTKLQVLSFKQDKTQPRMTFTNIAKNVWRTEGFKGYFKGVTARMMSITPVSFLLILTYEQVKRMSIVA